MAEAISGLRLQPLMLTASNIVIAHEVLIRLKSRQEPGAFFARQTASDTLALFLWQAEVMLNRSGTWFLNLPVKVLCDPLLIKPLLFFTHQNRLAIEIQDPENAVTLDNESHHFLKVNIHQLRKNGWMVWLDDWTLSVHDYYMKADIVFDGIKLDRSLITSPYLKRLINVARQLAPFILAEGIENEKLREHACFSAADIGQGFLWPEKAVDIKPDQPINKYLNKWLPQSENNCYSDVKVYCSLSDRYFTEGLIALMKQALHHVDPRKRHRICEVDEVHQADIYLSECMPGEKPFDFPGRCRSWNANIADLRCYHIRIVRDNALPSWVACSPDAAVINRKGCKDDAQKGLELVLKQLLRPWENPVYRCETKCSSCYVNHLSAREQETVIRFGTGQTVAVMAQEMGCSPKTVSVYKRRAMFKLRLLRNRDFIIYTQRVAEHRGTLLMQKIKTHRDR
ncbi:EAL domain-containing protein [Siccibacter turicensis]|uniref:EAL domain-containing protein n=1 Tax=Siccibacter turicensis TaxID=357233 RepID=UPI0013648C5A|nr:EAL domain-containing protein [Siccibacter turicensis]